MEEDEIQTFLSKFLGLQYNYFQNYVSHKIEGRTGTGKYEYPYIISPRPLIHTCPLDGLTARKDGNFKK